ncbi:MAG TPA: hypothetical protein VIL94_03350 [Acidothermaceae bacterium]|jgi:hypothetical protein
MTALQLVVADAQTKSANGAEGLLVFLFLAVALFFLLRSMTKHLRKAQLMKVNEADEPGDAGAFPDTSPDDPPRVPSQP